MPVMSGLNGQLFCFGVRPGRVGSPNDESIELCFVIPVVGHKGPHGPTYGHGH
jgi:hypothetical protein